MKVGVAVADESAAIGNADAALAYGQDARGEFGGQYVHDGVLVVLFTERLEAHLTNLRQRVPFPDAVRVAVTSRPLEMVEADRIAVRALLARRTDIPVVSVGVTRGGDEFVVEVLIFPFTPAAQQAVSTLVAPRAVEVREGRTPRRL